MVVRNKLYRIIDKYRLMLKKRESGPYGIHIIKGNESKNKILDFFLKNGRWPKRLNPKNKTELKLAQSFENFISKVHLGYDANLRRIVMATGRKSNHKHKHDIKGNKKAILEFIEKYGRVPSSHSGATMEGEGALRKKLDHYTKVKKDMTLLGQVYSVDKCHKSGIPMKYRSIINESLDVKKPLIRLV